MVLNEKTLTDFLKTHGNEWLSTAQMQEIFECDFRRVNIVTAKMCLKHVLAKREHLDYGQYRNRKMEYHLAEPIDILRWLAHDIQAVERLYPAYEDEWKDMEDVLDGIIEEETRRR